MKPGHSLLHLRSFNVNGLSFMPTSLVFKSVDLSFVLINIHIFNLFELAQDNLNDTRPL